MDAKHWQIRNKYLKVHQDLQDVLHKHWCKRKKVIWFYVKSYSNLNLKEGTI